MQARVPPKLPRILLVEDDTISQAYFRAVLEALPTDVDAVTTHACAVARAGAERHDLWLVDLTLPDGSGIELLRELRKRWPQPPPA
ncbi:MAG: response regulator, partial [Xanthomonadaceae bacterium]|nr:response regulator [Xanthomonadaceae bacterium]